MLEINLGMPLKAKKSREEVQEDCKKTPEPQLKDVLRASELGDAQQLSGRPSGQGGPGTEESSSPLKSAGCPISGMAKP